LNRRDTVDALRPNASGTASAHRAYSRGGEAAQDLVQPPGVQRSRLLESLVRLQRHFAIAEPISDPRHLNRNLLIGEINRPTLAGPPHVPWLTPFTGVPLAGQPCHFVLQLLVDSFERHWNQRLDQRHARVEVRCRRPGH
jgi:hypothetical protein